MSQPPENGERGQETLIALGSNATSQVGDAAATVSAALTRLESLFPGGFAASRLYRTPCFPAGAGPDFVNAAVRAVGEKSPQDVLDSLHEIEAEFGRERRVRWGQRTLDLDLIAIGGVVLPDAETHAAWRNATLDRQQSAAPDRLILPHPRLQDRSFVLVPLADVAPAWRHPVLGLSIAEMLAARPAAERAEVAPL